MRDGFGSDLGQESQRRVLCRVGDDSDDDAKREGFVRSARYRLCELMESLILREEEKNGKSPTGDGRWMMSDGRTRLYSL